MQELSHDQVTVLGHLMEWYKKDKHEMQFVTLGGYAGTGKTTLIAILRKELALSDKTLTVAFASYTGKAARVLQTKLREEDAILKGDSVGTIHSLIYTPVVNDREEIVGWKQKESLDCGLIILDEASMIDGMIWDHLRSYGKPIIVVGDHGQLPPIKGNFNLMEKPDITLDEIHRQAAKNPIIGVSIQARTSGIISTQAYSPTVIKFDSTDSETGERLQEMLGSYSPDTLILCGYNSTRKRLNAHIRNSLGFESPDPVSGDRVICLRNNHKQNIFNGMMGTVRRISKSDSEWYAAEIDMDGTDDAYVGRISVAQFHADSALNFTDQRSRIMHGDLFDFGYAITVHKAQGSQARKVILFEERFKKMDDSQWRRWLYTAVTRAEEELYIFPSQ